MTTERAKLLKNMEAYELFVNLGDNFTTHPSDTEEIDILMDGFTPEEFRLAYREFKGYSVDAPKPIVKTAKPKRKRRKSAKRLAKENREKAERKRVRQSRKAAKQFGEHARKLAKESEARKKLTFPMFVTN